MPDTDWPAFEGWHRLEDAVALHRSVLVAALIRGHLAKVTSAVHRFLLDGDEPRPELRRQYVQDLRERWMYKATPVERHRKFKILMGRLVELQMAEWLEQQGWTIVALEAFRHGPDIEARFEETDNAAFELKFIGAEDLDFDQVVRAIATESSATSVSPQAAANFLLFRAYESATQLLRSTRRRIAVVIIDDTAWWRFDAILTHGWIDWSCPRFLDADEAWNAFFREQERQFPGLASFVRSQLGAISELWILRRDFGYEYARVETIALGRA